MRCTRPASVKTADSVSSGNKIYKRIDGLNPIYIIAHDFSDISSNINSAVGGIRGLTVINNEENESMLLMWCPNSQSKGTIFRLDPNLNGGFDRWKEENKKISKDPINYPKNNFKSIPQNGLFCTKEEVINSLTDNNVSIINALRSTLHDGSEKVDYGRLGHIKNSINIPSLEMVDSNTNLYKSLDDLKIIFKKHNVLNKEKVIAYCGGGIAATNIAFVLTALGFENITVYDASLSEWAKNNNLPMSID